MNPNTNTNYLTNSLSKAKEFLQQASTAVRENINQSRYGTYMSSAGPAVNARNIPKSPADLPDTAATIVSDLLTDQTRRQVWKTTNPFRMAGEIGTKVAAAAGMDPVTGAAVALGTPIVLATLGNRYGSIQEGLRPKGYKSVIPVSKEEDPSGRKSMSPIAEAALRFGLGQTSQILPWQDFKQERPDIAPSTYSNYRRYEHSKPEPGKLASIDPETGSFTTAGGLVRGTTRGLNDPEVRIKGFPITLSSALGTAAGLAATGLAYKSLPTDMKTARSVTDPFGSIKKQVDKTTGEISMSLPKNYYPSTATTAGVLAAGVGTAALVSHIAKKTLQKAADNKLKKDDPVEYLKHKHGSLEQASNALGQPSVNSWQQLVPYAT